MDYEPTNEMPRPDYLESARWSYNLLSTYNMAAPGTNDQLLTLIDEINIVIRDDIDIVTVTLDFTRWQN